MLCFPISPLRRLLVLQQGPLTTLYLCKAICQNTSIIRPLLEHSLSPFQLQGLRPPLNCYGACCRSPINHCPVVPAPHSRQNHCLYLWQFFSLSRFAVQSSLQLRCKVLRIGNFNFIPRQFASHEIRAQQVIVEQMIEMIANRVWKEEQ